jgi:23S rRNA-/tRNA-specific pseudouridylate synthase
LDFRSWIVFEDEHLVVVCKPAGVLSQGGDEGAGHNLVDLARAYLHRDSGVGVLHRLDRNVSGLVLLAKTPRTASVLTRAFAAGAVLREYQAICALQPHTVEALKQSKTNDATAPLEWIVSARLRKNERTNEVSALDEQSPAFALLPEKLQAEYKPSRTLVRLVNAWESPVHAHRWLGHCYVQPVTGRSHQIRVHLAHVQLPIVGDPKYGVTAKRVSRPLLHAWKLEFKHPVTQQRVVLTNTPDWDGLVLSEL